MTTTTKMLERLKKKESNLDLIDSHRRNCIQIPGHWCKHQHTYLWRYGTVFNKYETVIKFQAIGGNISTPTCGDNSSRTQR